MSGLLALVANTVLFAWAVTAEVANLTAVVALLALSAVSGHVPVTTARVASLPTGAEATLVSTLESTLVAVAGNVSDLAALVALGSTATLVSTLCSLLGALARKMSGLVALVAGLLLWCSCALTAQMTVQSAVVANWISALWALTGLVSSLTAVVATTSASIASLVSTGIHFVVGFEEFVVCAIKLVAV